MSDRAEAAILAGGCFWPAQELLRHRKGVISTRVGYTGGENDNPTDENHPAHAEAVKTVFDPLRISYRGQPGLPLREAEAEDEDCLQRYPDRYTFFPRPGLEAPDRESAAASSGGEEKGYV